VDEAKEANVVRAISLVNGGQAVVDDDDYDRLIAMGPWRRVPGRNTDYARSCRVPKTLMHHAVTGNTLLTDHKDENGLNNQHHNLSNVSHSQNARRSSRSKGYRKWGRVWQVRMRVEGKSIIEAYPTEAEAKARVQQLKWKD
jgi:hypothetical protein